MDEIAEIMRKSEIKEDFFAQCVDVAAIELVGTFLLNKIDDKYVGGQILETESYCQHNPAAHCYSDICEQKRLSRQPRPRRMHDTMYSPPGHVYIYPNSNHCCLNFVCREEGFGAGILIRSVLPLGECQSKMKELRKEYIANSNYLDNPKNLCSGPIMLCHALGIKHNLDNQPLSKTSLKIFRPKISVQVLADFRIGIPKTKKPADTWRRRYVLKTGNAGFHKPIRSPVEIIVSPTARGGNSEALSKCGCCPQGISMDF